MREALVRQGFRAEADFRWRGHEVLRIEAFADAVFAFAVTLLIISLEVPKTFDELLGAMRGFVAFAAGFAMLFWIWTYQFRYFRRYGLQDAVTLWLNAALLFVVLFYTYPLKFLSTLLSTVWLGGTTEAGAGGAESAMGLAQVAKLMAIYSGGFMAVFLVFTLLYVHAWRQRVVLELDDAEANATREQIQESAINVVVGGLSILLAFTGGRSAVWLSVIPYWLMGLLQWANGSYMRRQRKLIAG
ncbi:MAG: TMEM175 family protein [Gemmatimonadota bacterium]